MPTPDIKSLAETWLHRRSEFIDPDRMDGAKFRHFVELQNHLSRQLIAALDMHDPELWQALTELATNAATLTTRGAKIFADKQDVTNL